MELNEKLIDGLTDEEIEFLTEHQEIDEILDDIKSSIKDYSAQVEAIKQINPKFEGKTLKQLKNDKEFQQALKEYRATYPSAEITEQGKIEEVLKSIIPKKHIKPVNKLANTITKDLVDKGEFDLVISNKRSRREVFTKVMLAYDNKYIQLSGQKYTPYDREVYDGVVTLYAAGNNLITPAMVYRAMNGLTESEKIRPETLEKVKQSLDKSMRIYTVIDYTDEAKMYNPKIEKTTYEGYLLAAEKVTVKINGETHEAYKILSPILYNYAQISGQIITVPMKLMKTKDAVRGTDEVIVIRGYLLRQIEWMRNEKVSRSENIAYKSIYEELSITRDFYNDGMYKKKTHTTRTHIKAILDEWKEEGYIIGYEEYQDGNRITGIKIRL